MRIVFILHTFVVYNTTKINKMTLAQPNQPVSIKELTDQIQFKDVILFNDSLYIDDEFGLFYVVARVEKFDPYNSDNVWLKHLEIDITYDDEPIELSKEDKTIILELMIKDSI